MMNGSMNKQTVKGFTIIEMIVVIAIIGILLGVLAPSMMTYYRNSRLRAANANAKMVYNAAQTEVMRYANQDRVEKDAAKKSGFASNVWMAYSPGSGNRYLSGPSEAGSLVDTTDGSVTAGKCNETIARVNLQVSGAADVCWAVYVNNYIVKASVSADNMSTNYVGFYSANKQQADEPSSSSYSTSYMSLLDSVSDNYDKS